MEGTLECCYVCKRKGSSDCEFCEPKWGSLFSWKYEPDDCPFCGGKAGVVDITPNSKLIVVKCTVCGSATRPFGKSNWKDAIKLWNTRFSRNEED